MAALRFKKDRNGAFLGNNAVSTKPHWPNLWELQHAAETIEEDKQNEKTGKKIEILIAPGSSLGSTGSKADILDDQHNPWFVNFPSVSDTTDKAAWEYLAYQLANQPGLQMAESRVDKIAGK